MFFVQRRVTATGPTRLPSWKQSRILMIFVFQEVLDLWIPNKNTWMFPKIGVPPKWMVYNGKPYKNGWFRKHPYTCFCERGENRASVFMVFWIHAFSELATRARMLRHFLGWVGWGMLTFVRTCDTRACYVTSWLGWGGGCWRSWELATHAHATSLLGLVGVGDVEVLENLRHTRAASEFGNGVGWTPKKIFWEKTGRMLDKRMCSWKGKKIRASFQHKNPCNLQAMMLKPFDFPRENWRIFEMKVNSFAVAKTTFFSKTLKTLARFSPRRDVFPRETLTPDTVVLWPFQALHCAACRGHLGAVLVLLAVPSSFTVPWMEMALIWLYTPVI